MQGVTGCHGDILMHGQTDINERACQYEDILHGLGFDHKSLHFC